MDLKGSLLDTNLKIYPSKHMINFLESLTDINIPKNIQKVIKGDDYEPKGNCENTVINVINFTNEDIGNLKKIKESYSSIKKIENYVNREENKQIKTEEPSKEKLNSDKSKVNDNKLEDNSYIKKSNVCYLNTSDINWLYTYIQKRKTNGDKNIPYLHVLLEGASIEIPENQTIKRNPVLEARCVKLRAQQEAREYKKMTKSVDNVRMRFPDDSIAYQLKQVNRQLIAVGQFLISIFAGFLFGFQGVEWMIGNLDFGFRLLLGVMCALVIALAEIYFLAKKLNEELNVPETVQLGGPIKFANPPKDTYSSSSKAAVKEHQD